MGVGEDFKTFCDNIAIQNQDSISQRYKAITKRLNLDFWDSDSDVSHSLYVGSYGRGTAIDGTSDVDMLFWLPSFRYERYDKYAGNGQSAMLQDVRNSMQKTYSSSKIGADGQVVVVSFTDDLTFEVLPSFVNNANSFTYPDSNSGGSWRSTNPKPEIDAMYERDKACNWNLRLLCKMMRPWKNLWSVPMGGMLIDTLAYTFIKDWAHRDKSYLYYDYMTRDFFQYMSGQSPTQDYWLSPGANQRVYKDGDFQYKAKRSYNISLAAIEHAVKGETWSSRQKWREIYGGNYPDS